MARGGKTRPKPKAKATNKPKRDPAPRPTKPSSKKGTDSPEVEIPSKDSKSGSPSGEAVKAAAGATDDTHGETGMNDKAKQSSTVEGGDDATGSSDKKGEEEHSNSGCPQKDHPVGPHTIDKPRAPETTPISPAKRPNPSDTTTVTDPQNSAPRTPRPTRKRNKPINYDDLTPDKKPPKKKRNSSGSRTEKRGGKAAERKKTDRKHLPHRTPLPPKDTGSVVGTPPSSMRNIKQTLFPDSSPDGDENGSDGKNKSEEAADGFDHYRSRPSSPEQSLSVSPKTKRVKEDHCGKKVCGGRINKMKIKEQEHLRKIRETNVLVGHLTTAMTKATSENRLLHVEGEAKAREIESLQETVRKLRNRITRMRQDPGKDAQGTSNSKSGSSTGKQRKKKMSHTEIRDAIIASGADLDIKNFTGGLMHKIVRRLTSAEFLTPAVDQTLRSLERADMYDWDDPTTDKKVFGYIPRAKLSKFEEDMPLSHVWSRPCEMIPEGYGTPIFRAVQNSYQPSALTSHKHSVPSVGRSVLSKHIENSSRSFGFVPTNPMRIMASGHPMDWTHNLAESLPELETAKGPHHDKSRLNLHQIMVRLADTIMHDEKVIPEEDLEDAINAWRTKLLADLSPHISSAEREEKVQDLGISDGGSITNLDRTSFRKVVFKGLGTLHHLETYLRKIFILRKGTIRRESRRIFLEGLQLGEFDPNLCPSGSSTRKDKERKERKKNWAKRDEINMQTYQALGGGDPVPDEGNPGKFRRAITYEEYSAGGHGDMSRWRRECHETMPWTVPEDEDYEAIGFPPSGKDLTVDELIMSKWVRENPIMPTEMTERKRGPHADRLFRTKLSRRIYIQRNGRFPVQRYINQNRLPISSPPNTGSAAQNSETGGKSGTEKTLKNIFFKSSRIQGLTSVMPVAILDVDISGAVHDRMIEMKYDVATMPAGARQLYQEMCKAAMKNLLFEIRNIMLDIPAVAEWEIFVPWDFFKAYRWKLERKEKKQNYDLEPGVPDEDARPCTLKLRTEFEEYIKPYLPVQRHLWEYFGEGMRKNTTTHWSSQDRTLYLVAKPESYAENVNSWMGKTVDGYIGQLNEWDFDDPNFDGKFKPMSYEWEAREAGHFDEDSDGSDKDADKEDNSDESFAKRAEANIKNLKAKAVGGKSSPDEESGSDSDNDSDDLQCFTDAESDSEDSSEESGSDSDDEE